MTAGAVPGVARIAVLRAGGIGDLVFALPALRALRAAYPAARIDLLASAWAASFLGSRPSPVDRVLALPAAAGVSAPEHAPLDARAEAALDAFLDDRRADGYDLAVQLHGGGRHSNPLVASLGARVTAGLRAPGAASLDRWVRYEYWQHEVLRLLDVVALVGARPVVPAPSLAVTDADLAEADTVLGDDRSRRLAVLNPGATDPRRRWPTDRFAAVGDVLAARGLRVLVTGGPGDEDLADGVVAAMGQPARSLAARLSLGGLTGLLARASVVVSNDTGPLHLARAVGTSTVGIYWCGNAVNAGIVRADRHRVALSWQLRCDVCGVDCMASDERCPHDPSFVRGVEVEEVVGHALDLLGERPAAPAHQSGAILSGISAASEERVEVDVLVPTCDRPAALAVTLASLVGQVGVRFRVVVSDQSTAGDPFRWPEVRAVVNVLRATDREVRCLRHLPRRGLAEHRQFLLDQAAAPYVLFLDDDVVCEPDLLARLVGAVRRERCGFVGSFVNAPGSVWSEASVDEPPPGVGIELWDGPVEPEVVARGSPAWERHRLHFAAYLRRLGDRLGLARECERLYKVAWVGGCVLFDTAAPCAPREASTSGSSSPTATSARTSSPSCA